MRLFYIYDVIIFIILYSPFGFRISCAAGKDKWQPDAHHAYVPVAAHADHEQQRGQYSESKVSANNIT